MAPIKSPEEGEDIERSTRVETSLSNLTNAFNGFLQEYKKDRDDTWKAIQTLSEKGRITWPQIIASISALVTLLCLGAKMGELYVEGRVALVEEKGRAQREHVDTVHSFDDKLDAIRLDLIRSEMGKQRQSDK